ncbi:MAG: hypothetical protein UH850_03425 [Paludibacteraceae bacterium]|nr:hypothetical protein [Paludibacteraceae bacterium]
MKMLIIGVLAIMCLIMICFTKRLQYLEAREAKLEAIVAQLTNLLKEKKII